MEAPNTWRCAHCGKNNPVGMVWCDGCGEQREDKPAGGGRGSASATDGGVRMTDAEVIGATRAAFRLLATLAMEVSQLPLEDWLYGFTQLPPAQRPPGLAELQELVEAALPLKRFMMAAGASAHATEHLGGFDGARHRN